MTHQSPDSMDIRMVDLRSQYLRIKDDIDAAIQQVIYEPGFSPEDADAAARMRAKLAAADGGESIKRGRSGGVVDIEFIAQMLALRHGRTHPGTRAKGRVRDL